MPFEIWTAYRYGSVFGSPETRLHEGLTEDQVAQELRGDHGILLHKLLVIHDKEETLANKWLVAYEKNQTNA